MGRELLRRLPRRKRALLVLAFFAPAIATALVASCAPDRNDGTPRRRTYRYDAQVLSDDAAERSTRSAEAGADGDKEEEEAVRDPLVERGRYLVDHVAGCGDCHTPGAPAFPDTTRYLAGVECLVRNDDGACLHSANLTSARSGLATYSDAQIKRMFREGRRPEGKVLHPLMPYWVFRNMTDEDAEAVVRYLRTVPPVDHIVPPNDLPFITRRPAAPIDPNTIPRARAAQVDGGPDLENGRYLAAMAGRCLECHTEDAPAGAPRPIDMRRPFGGDRAFSSKLLGLSSPPFPATIYSSNITPAPVSGIGGWTIDDVVRAMREGRDRNHGRMCPPMPFGPMGGYAGLTDEDARDIAAYILSLPPIDRFTSGTCLVQVED